MIKLYREYRLVKYVDTENDSIIEAVNTVVGLRLFTEPPNVKMVSEHEVITQFAKMRVLGRPVTEKTAFKVMNSALEEGYLEHEYPENKSCDSIVATSKGQRLIEGLPLFRIGLANAMFKEYGALASYLTTGAAGLAIGYCARSLWHAISH